MTEAMALTKRASEILSAASELFYAHGIHAVGVDAIAERAGVSKKTLYERFGSKERLVVAYVTERDQRWRSFLQNHLERAGARPLDQMSAVFRASHTWAAERGGKGCGMINAHAEISDPDHPAYPVIVGQKQWMLDLFHEIAHHANASEPGEIAEQLMLLHEGALVSAGMNTFDDVFTRAEAAGASLIA